MTITLSPETQKLLEEQMKTGQFSDADEVLRLALQTLSQTEAGDYDDLDADTRAAIEESEAQLARGEGSTWEDVREELRAKFIKE